MTLQRVVLVLGLTLIVSGAILCGIYLGFLRSDRKKKDKVYSELKDLLNEMRNRGE